MAEIEGALNNISSLNKQAEKAGIGSYTWSSYELENKIEKVKGDIMSRVLSKEINKISKNINIDNKKVMNELKVDSSQMDFQTLISSINKSYGVNREKIAFEQLLKSAKQLVPYSKKIEIKKSKLILEGGDETSIDNLNRLTGVIIDNVLPSKAVSNKRIIDWKKYQNRRVDVLFDNPETSEKMEKVLRLL